VRTVCGWARRVQLLVGRNGPRSPETTVRPLAGGRSPLLTDRPGLQTRAGVPLDQVDGTTCGSAVLIALAAWADPAETARLDGGPVLAGASAGAGFGARFDARQKQVHRESTRFWPQALGTSPWGMVAWLRRHAPAAGPHRVRLVDDGDPRDVAAVIAEAGAALAAGRPVPLLVGAFVPRHYCLALAPDSDTAWRVYEPSSGEVRVVPHAVLGTPRLAPLLGFGHLEAVLLPS
jgi:hypothetical protein